jgi:hypothetical protein
VRTLVVAAREDLEIAREVRAALGAGGRTPQQQGPASVRVD